MLTTLSLSLFFSNMFLDFLLCFLWTIGSSKLPELWQKLLGQGQHTISYSTSSLVMWAYLYPVFHLLLFLLINIRSNHSFSLHCLCCQCSLLEQCGICCLFRGSKSAGEQNVKRRWTRPTHLLVTIGILTALLSEDLIAKPGSKAHVLSLNVMLVMTTILISHLECLLTLSLMMLLHRVFVKNISIASGGA